MKKFLVIAMLLAAAAALLGCFDDDPFAGAETGGTSVTGAGGTITGIYYPGVAGVNPYGFAAVSQVSFPVTLSINFSGFVDGQGQAVTEPITRMSLLYFSTAGRWVVLRDIRNPQFDVICAPDETRTLFGQRTITSAMGYRASEIMPVLVYFSTANYQNFDLASVLASTNRAVLPSQTIGLMPTGNTKPY